MAIGHRRERMVFTGEALGAMREVRTQVDDVKPPQEPCSDWLESRCMPPHAISFGVVGAPLPPRGCPTEAGDAAALGGAEGLENARARLTRTHLQWVKQLNNALARVEQVEEAWHETQVGVSVTLWTTTAPQRTPVFLHADASARRGLRKIIFSRYVDLREGGLGDVARALVEGARRGDGDDQS